MMATVRAEAKRSFSRSCGTEVIEPVAAKMVEVRETAMADAARGMTTERIR